MTRPHRKAHVVLWAIVAPALVLLLVTVWRTGGGS